MNKKELKNLATIKRENEHLKGIIINFTNMLYQCKDIDELREDTMLSIFRNKSDKLITDIKIEAYKEFSIKLKNKPDLYTGWIVSPIIFFKDVDETLSEFITKSEF